MSCWVGVVVEAGKCKAVFAACMNAAGTNLTLPDLWRFGKLVHAGRTVRTRVNVTDLHGLGGAGPTRVHGSTWALLYVCRLLFSLVPIGTKNFLIKIFNLASYDVMGFMWKTRWQ